MHSHYSGILATRLRIPQEKTHKCPILHGSRVQHVIRVKEHSSHDTLKEMVLASLKEQFASVEYFGGLTAGRDQADGVDLWCQLLTGSGYIWDQLRIESSIGAQLAPVDGKESALEPIEDMHQTE